jgi:hypothetical protein
MELVDQAVREQRSHESAAPRDVDVALQPLLQAADRVGVVRTDDRRVPPRRIGERGGDDVLRRVVEERRTGIVLRGPFRPGLRDPSYVTRPSRCLGSAR